MRGKRQRYSPLPVNAPSALPSAPGFRPAAKWRDIVHARLATGCVAAALAILTQTVFMTGLGISPAVFLAVLLVALAFHLFIALSLGWVREGRLSAALAFSFPASRALELGASLTVENVCGCLVVLAAVFFWTRFFRCRSQPVAATVGGLACGIARASPDVFVGLWGWGLIAAGVLVLFGLRRVAAFGALRPSLPWGLAGLSVTTAWALNVAETSWVSTPGP